jgi:hypothetical protein
MPHAGSSKIDTFDVESAYQNGPRRIRVLLPDSYAGTRPYRVLYVLPVEADLGSVFGDGLTVLREMNAHNDYDIIIVEMKFEKEPWFGDSAADPQTRQASYLKDFVVPFIEQRYSTPGNAEGRLLFGFSKSGWGAFSLILTYPEFFGYAASWDAPMLLTGFHFGMSEVYGTAGQLSRYRPDLLIPRQKEFFQRRTRLVLAGEELWGTLVPAPGGGSHTVEAHELLALNGIKHHYDCNLNAPHRWDKSWMMPALKALMMLAEQNGSKGARKRNISGR